MTSLAPPLAELAQILVDLLAAEAGLIALWHTERGQVLPPAGAGLPPEGLAQLGQLLTTAAPDLLQILTGARPAGARFGVLPGWQIDPPRRAAQVATAWGPMHVLAVPIDSAVALLALVYTAPSLDPWGTRPYVVRLAVRHIELAWQAGERAARLVDEAQWLDSVLEQSLEGLVLVDPAGRVISCNPAATRLTGWRADDLRGRSLVEALQARPMSWAGAPADGDDLWAGPLAGDPAGAADRAPAPAADESPRGPAIELVLTSRQGSQIYTTARVTPVAVGGRTLGAIVSFQDVTAGREAEELQATFLSVISHELQTPLAVIRGYAELLADQLDVLPPPQVRHQLAVVAEESARLSAMVASLLDASRIGAGGLELTLEPVNIPRLVRYAVQKVALLSSRHQFVIAVPDDLPPVLADYARIEQVVINLLNNAVKYSPAGGRITLTSDLLSDEVILHISDEGIGVPEAERQRIFSRFARLNSRVVRQMKGVGLGLYIARAIITAHGGRIWVNAAPGGGAQFSFSLPRQYKAPLPVVFGRR
ncbi:MAG TPA: ATP-binding protein [Chloroflexia bacterium]|nr:ATP-binding protein [Chloroflexia bacterium]